MSSGIGEAHGQRPATFLPIGIADGIRTSAAATPDKVALVEGERQLSYRDFVSRMDRVANGVLHDVGLGSGRPRGGARTELHRVPRDRVRPRLGRPGDGHDQRSLVRSRGRDDRQRRRGASAVRPPVARGVAREAELETVERVIVIGEEYEHWLSSARAEPCGVHIEEWDPFCIPYTSGTTGEPNGVLLSHRSRALTFFAMAVAFGCYSSNDRALALAPLYHGAGFAFAAAPIFFGGFCEILPKFDPELVLQRLENATNAFMVPSHFQAILALGNDTLTRYRPSHLRTLISNAAPLDQVTKERVIAYFGDGLLHECYGSTESGITSSIGPADQLRKQQCVGLPFPLHLGAPAR